MVLGRHRVVGSGNGAWGIATLVSIPCHLEPDMMFSLTRSGALRQPSSCGIQGLCLLAVKYVCAGVLVICLVAELALRHAPSLTSSLTLVEVETLPSECVFLSHSSFGLRLSGTMVSSDFSFGILLDFTSSAYTIRYAGMPATG